MFIIRRKLPSGPPHPIVDMLTTQQSAAGKLAELAASITPEQVEWKEPDGTNSLIMSAEVEQFLVEVEQFVVECYDGQE